MRYGALTLGILALVVAGCGGSSEDESIDQVSSELSTTTRNVNCGGPEVGGILYNGNMTLRLVADEGFTGGSTINHPEVAIDMSHVPKLYPPPLFQTARVGRSGFSYTYGPYAANAAVSVQLLFAETYFKTAGSRQFNVTINGAPALSNFDIFQAAGGKGVALEKILRGTTDANGFVKIQFSPIANKDQPLVSGITVFPVQMTGMPGTGGMPGTAGMSGM